MNKNCEYGLIAGQISELNKKIIYLCSGGHITPAINILAEQAEKMVGLHRLVQLINCLQLADKLYLDGNQSEQELIKERFADLLVKIHESVTNAEWCAIKKYIPDPIFDAFSIRKHKIIPFLFKKK